MKNLLLLFCVACAAGCERRDEHQPSSDAPLPKADGVMLIRAQWYPAPNYEEHRFDVHEQFGPILDALVPNRFDPHPMKWTVRGALNFIMKDGTIVGMSVFQTAAGDSLAFRMHDKYYVGGSETKLDKILSKMAAASKHFDW
jgi:hypothetical protein